MDSKMLRKGLFSCLIRMGFLRPCVHKSMRYIKVFIRNQIGIVVMLQIVCAHILYPVLPSRPVVLKPVLFMLQ